MGTQLIWRRCLWATGSRGMGGKSRLLAGNSVKLREMWERLRYSRVRWLLAVWCRPRNWNIHSTYVWCSHLHKTARSCGGGGHLLYTYNGWDLTVVCFYITYCHAILSSTRGTSLHAPRASSCGLVLLPPAPKPTPSLHLKHCIQKGLLILV